MTSPKTKTRSQKHFTNSRDFNDKGIILTEAALWQWRSWTFDRPARGGGGQICRPFVLCFKQLSSFKNLRLQHETDGVKYEQSRTRRSQKPDVTADRGDDRYTRFVF